MVLDIKNLSVTYQNNVRALEDISVSISSGKLVGIIGTNGAGKSTLLKGILGMVERTGSVSFKERPIKEVQKQVAYVEQKGNLDMDFPITVLQCVLLGTYPKLGWLKRPGKKEKETALDALERVGMEDFANRQISELSGGQLQRILIARTLAQDADLIFLDEPFSAIDIKSEGIIMDQLFELRDQGKTILIVHHDLIKVAHYFDELILLNQRLIASGKVEEVMTDDNLSKVFGTDAFKAIGGN
ncbi:metal ABC transporter ATP-binding protein [Aerococcus sp. HMSC10H05]|uniref:metal ABC transporter ATP-binding protein n=1 Tax=Aerococcus sp. HMSC10H05 TaxID=1581084 RepID=UPI0008A177CD|nr:metal ABC transporter ATP-binding protein [Aerococcus sp. HMSC10H05]OFU50213.1 manganese ABC transporter ATP-binding protein [Aerococcus sp. HMSC10H05]